MSNPAELIKRAIQNSPRGSEKEHFESVLAMMDRGHYRFIFDYWFANTYRTFEVEVTENSTVVTKKIRKLRAKAKRARKALREKLEMVLMDHLLTNGKLLRYATFADCAKEGGWLTTLSKLGKPTQVVGQQLTESDLINLQRRNTR